MRRTDLRRSVLNYLESKSILCFPTQPTMLSTSKCTKEVSEIRVRGMTDLLAFYQSERMGTIPVWLEVRSRRGRQTPDQKQFQALVESKRHVYMVITSVQAAKEFFD